MEDIMRWTFATTAASVVCAAAVVFAQSIGDLRKPFDAGQYQQVISAGGGSQDPHVVYLVAMSHQKLRHTDEARNSYQQLAARPDADAWHHIGASAVAILSSNADAAAAEADQAVAKEDSLAEAHYQRGLALSAKQDMGGAAAEFQKATDIDPNWAYAHYYAGIAYSKIKRADLTASHFQAFLRIAPQAPERGEVQSILRTLGGD
jgi:tetratricopeptide (TPR) repeat protein